jgi:hypothetical protein
MYIHCTLTNIYDRLPMLKRCASTAVEFLDAIKIGSKFFFFLLHEQTLIFFHLSVTSSLLKF